MLNFMFVELLPTSIFFALNTQISFQTNHNLLYNIFLEFGNLPVQEQTSFKQLFIGLLLVTGLLSIKQWDIQWRHAHFKSPYIIYPYIYKYMHVYIYILINKWNNT